MLSARKVWSFMRGSRGGGGRGSGPPPLANHKNIGFLSNTGLDSLKNHKFAKPASKPSQHASETPFNGVSLVDR